MKKTLCLSTLFCYLVSNSLLAATTVSSTETTPSAALTTVTKTAPSTNKAASASATAAPATSTTTTITSTPAPTTKPSATAAPTPSTTTSTVTNIATVRSIDCLYQISNTPVSEKELSLWAQYAAVKAFDYRFDQLDTQLQKLKSCFTEQGWAGFTEALVQSGNLSIIKDQKLTVSSQISGQSVISSTKDGQWQIIVPIDVVYQNNQEKFTQSLAVMMIVTKKSSSELGIVQLIATVKSEKPSAM